METVSVPEIVRNERLSRNPGQGRSIVFGLNIRDHLLLGRLIECDDLEAKVDVRRPY
jgi:hypothetical protein